MVSNGSERISNNAAKFFGVTPYKVPLERQISITDPELKWKRRRLRYINRRYSRYGGCKEEEAQRELGSEGYYFLYIKLDVDYATVFICDGKCSRPV